MESPRKRKKMELVSSVRRMDKLVNKTTFNHSTYLCDDLELVCLDNREIKFDKPMYIGMYIICIRILYIFLFLFLYRICGARGQ